MSICCKLKKAFLNWTHNPQQTQLFTWKTNGLCQVHLFFKPLSWSSNWSTIFFLNRDYRREQNVSASLPLLKAKRLCVPQGNTSLRLFSLQSYHLYLLCVCVQSVSDSYVESRIGRFVCVCVKTQTCKSTENKAKTFQQSDFASVLQVWFTGWRLRFISRSVAALDSLLPEPLELIFHLKTVHLQKESVAFFTFHGFSPMLMFFVMTWSDWKTQ